MIEPRQLPLPQGSKLPRLLRQRFPWNSPLHRSLLGVAAKRGLSSGHRLQRSFDSGSGLPFRHRRLLHLQYRLRPVLAWFTRNEETCFALSLLLWSWTKQATMKRDGDHNCF
jgi:hypothetical protein